MCASMNSCVCVYFLASVCRSISACVCVCVCECVIVCGPMCCSAPLVCSSRGLATCTTGGGKRVRMKGGDPGREGRMQAQGAGKERGKELGGRKGEG